MKRRFPIRTLHCLPELKEGGLERGVVDKAIWLQEHGIGAAVVSSGGIWVERLTDAGIPHYKLPIHRKNPLSVISCANAVREICRDEDIHLVSAHSRMPAWAAHLATRDANGHSPPLITEAQGYYERHFVSRIMVKADRVIAVSGAIRDHLVRSLDTDPSRIVVIPRGLDHRRFRIQSSNSRSRLRREWKIPPGSPLIVGVGRLTPTKGWHDLISAMAKIPDQSSHLVLVGSDHGRKRKYIRKLRRMIESLGISDRVRFAGHRDDIADVYSAADCVAAPSRLPEPFGRVIVEALACNRPVIATKGCGAAEFLGDDINHFIVLPADPDSLADRISWVLREPSLASSYVANIADRIRSELTIDRQMRETVDVYRDCRPDLPW